MELELPAEARALLDAVVAIGSDLDLRGVLRRIVETSCRLTGAEYGVLGTVDPSVPFTTNDSGAFIDLVAHGFSDEQIAGIGMMPAGHGLIGAVPQQRTAMRVDHVRDHPDSVGYPTGHPPIDRFLGAPVLVRDQAFGHLYLGKAAGGDPFTPTDQALVEALARAAGVIIDNARAYEESERRRAWMEGTVRITSALAPSLQADVSLQSMVDEVCTLSGARSVSLVQGDGELLEVAASSGATEDVTATVKRLNGQIRSAAASGDLLAVSTEAGRSTIIVPIHTELAPAGVLLIDHHTQTWASLRDLERDLLGAFADHLGLTLDRAQAMRERHELLVAKDRDRIARDLHDLVIQRLFATGMQLQSARNSGDLEALRRRVDDAVTELDTAISDLRATIFELGRGGGRSLHEEVRALIGEYAPVLGFLPALRTSGQVDGALAPAVADGLLMTLREALSNIARHAQASATTVELAATSRWFSLRVTDDGTGFDPGSVARGHGLDNAVHRAESLGGHVELRSAPGEGTRMEWVVPTIG